MAFSYRNGYYGRVALYKRCSIHLNAQKINKMTIEQITANWTKTDEIIFKTPKIKFDSLQEAKTKVIAKI